ncbi:tetraspanin-3-like [Numida meleagris]|uniref:tetraspanin-3-like n=1 Tax=Numida meleagris TaxID=8996 RepID=UPI000B3E334A|nr:tetraspanin-3-like [Numida meleagris]
MVVVRVRLLGLSKMWRVRTACMFPWVYEDSWLRNCARSLLMFLGVIFWGNAAVLTFGGCFVILFSELKSTMGQAFNQYNGTYSLAHGSRTVDMLQKKLQCCGLHNYTDWLKASAASWRLPSERSRVPRSCCKKYVDCEGDLSQLDQLFQEGCLRKLQDQLHYGMKFLFSCCVVLSVLEVLAGVSNGILMSHQPFYDFRFLESSVFS